MSNTLPSVEYLRECFNYDPETGKLFWKERPLHHYFHCKYPEAVMRGCNKKFAGKEALGRITSDGYKKGNLNRKLTASHRVIYKLIFGKDAFEIDHINGIKVDNRLENLREVTKSENCKNRKRFKTNKSGYTGVYATTNNKWKVRIRIDGKLLCLGTYENLSDAIEVRKKAEKDYNFHPNNGRE